MPDPSFPDQLAAPPSAVVALRPPPYAFSWTRRAERRGSISLVLAGELDLALREHFEAALADAQTDSDRVLLNLEALTLIDCANLGVVYAAAARSRREDTVLILFCAQGQVRRMLDRVSVPHGVVVIDRDDLPSDRSGVAT